VVDIASISLRVDTSDIKRGQVELKNLERTGSGVERNVTRATDGMSGGFASLRKTIGLVGTALAGIGSAQLIREAIQYSDAWKQVNNQLRQVTGSETELRGVRQTLLDISRQTNTELDSTVALYSTLTRSTKEMGISSQEVADVTKTVNNLFMVSGASAQEAANAIRQLSQGLAAGALRGDEFNAVAENAPRIMDAIAEKLQMTRGELREFAAQGGITSQVLVEALQDYNEEAQRMADQTDRTFGQHMVNANTNVTEFVGGLSGLNSSVSTLGQEIEDFTKIFSDNTAEINGFINETLVFAKSASLILKEITAQGNDDPWYMKPLTMGPAGMLYRYMGFGGKDEFENSKDKIIKGLEDIRKEADENKNEFDMLRNGEILAEKFGIALDETAGSAEDAAGAVKKFTFESKQLKDTLGNEVIKEVEALASEFSKIRDEIYPQQAAVRGLMREYEVLSQIAPGMISDWIDQRIAIDDVTRATVDLSEEADPMATAYVRGLERMRDHFGDFMYDLLDKGKVTFDGFLDMFKRMAAEITATKILVSIGLGGSGGAMAGTAGGDGLSSLMSLSGISKFLASNPLQSLGAGLKDWGWTSLGDSLGNMSVMDMGLSALAGYAGNFIGGSIGKSLFNKEAESAWAATIGGIGGSILGGPIGALVGSTIGSLLDSAFGGDGKKRSILGVTTRPDQDPFNLVTNQQQTESGLLLSTYTIRAGEQAQEVADGLLAAMKLSDSALSGLYRTLGADVDFTGVGLAGKTPQIGTSEAANFFGASDYNNLDIAAVEGAVDAFVEAWIAKANEMTKTVIDINAIKELQKEGELLVDTIIRISNQLQPVNSILDAMGFAVYDLSISGMAAADSLLQLFGGLENLTSATNAYYQAFYSEEEKLAATTAQLQSVFDSLNITMPTTHQEFRNIVDGLDLASNAGQSMFAALMQIAPAFDHVTKAAEAAAEAARQAMVQQVTGSAGGFLDQYNATMKTRAELEQDLAGINADIADQLAKMADVADPLQSVSTAIDAITTSTDSLTYSSSQLRGWADNILGTVNSLMMGNGSPLTNLAKFNFARDQFSSARSTFESTGDASGLASAAQAYLQANTAFNASSQTGVGIFNDVVGYLQQVGVGLESEADRAERWEQEQQRLLEEQRSATDAVRSAQVEADSAAREAAKMAQEHAKLDALYQQQQAIELALQSSLAIDAEQILRDQLQGLVDMNTSLIDIAGLLDVLPEDMAVAIGDALLGNVLASVPGFASGGRYGGGLALVGEQGPELINFNRPGFVHNAGETRSMMDSDPALIAEVKALREEVSALRRETAQADAKKLRAAENTNRGIEDMGRKINRKPVEVLA